MLPYREQKYVKGALGFLLKTSHAELVATFVRKSPSLWGLISFLKNGHTMADLNTGHEIYPGLIYASVTSSPLAQIMACRLVGAKPLSEPRLEYGYLASSETNSMRP